jgi:hypothetical protein
VLFEGLEPLNLELKNHDMGAKVMAQVWQREEFGQVSS